MSIVNYIQLQNQALEHCYKLLCVNFSTLPIAKGTRNAAEKNNAPIVLSLDLDCADIDLLPSIEKLARLCKSPVALLAQVIETKEHASLSIRLGCNALNAEIHFGQHNKKILTILARPMLFPLLN